MGSDPFMPPYWEATPLCPHIGKRPLYAPLYAPVMNRGVVAELPGQIIPLAARTHLVNDAVEAFALVDAWPTHVGFWVELSQEREDKLVPKIVGNFPQGRQLRRRLDSCDPWLLGSSWLRSLS